MAGLGAAAGLVVARAQRAGRVARTGFVAFISENDPNRLDRARVFRQGLRFGWAPMIDYYWDAGEREIG
jgi:hypothetical protein